MKQVPTNKQEKEFLKIFKQEANKSLIAPIKEKDGELIFTTEDKVTNNQIRIIQTHGKFLSLIPESDYKKVSSILATKIKNYTFAFEEKLNQMLNESEQEKERDKLLKKSESLRKNLINPLKTISDEDMETDMQYVKMNENMRTYQQFIELFDLFISELKNLNIQQDIRETRILQAEQFSKSIQASKTDIKKYLTTIFKKYKLKGYSKDIKKLIDKLTTY